MATFLLVPGGGGVAWCWHRVVPLLEAAGHEVIALDLPGDDPEAGLAAYVERVHAAAGERGDLVLVGHSLGGFTVAVAAAQLGASRLARVVFVSAMIPAPGETAGAWWEATGSREARTAAARRDGYAIGFDFATYFTHDLSQELVEALADRERDESAAVFEEPARFERLPAVPVEVVIARDDRLFPADFQRRVARERLGPGARVTEIPGGHMVALSHPRELAEVLVRDV